MPPKLVRASQVGNPAYFKSSLYCSILTAPTPTSVSSHLVWMWKWTFLLCDHNEASRSNNRALCLPAGSPRRASHPDPSVVRAPLQLLLWGHYNRTPTPPPPIVFFNGESVSFHAPVRSTRSDSRALRLDCEGQQSGGEGRGGCGVLTA